MRTIKAGAGQLSLLEECLHGQDRAVLTFARLRGMLERRRRMR